MVIIVCKSYILGKMRKMELVALLIAFSETCVEFGNFLLFYFKDLYNGNIFT